MGDLGVLMISFHLKPQFHLIVHHHHHLIMGFFFSGFLGCFSGGGVSSNSSRKVACEGAVKSYGSGRGDSMSSGSKGSRSRSSSPPIIVSYFPVGSQLSRL
ncbi:hypothetical protein MLD38_036844 [Melastoma candidum]|uniref:Uncharacterized protein n=1 Tax=Melastoma candidum TaxID=119954 RepID=A0ACB9LLG4_9MYRT|nr:hypothetical protein MLD38_036844 [Melastoma candidum]